MFCEELHFFDDRGVPWWATETSASSVLSILS